MSKFLTVAGSKGGVGKTTVAINIATALSDFGRDIILVDASLETADIGLNLGAPMVKTTLHDVLNKDASIRDAVYSHPSGIRVIPGSISLDKARNVLPERLEEVLHDISGTSEAIIIDTPSGLGKETVSALRMADHVLVVTEPDLPSVTNSLKTVKLAEKLGSKVLGIIVNRYTDRSEMTPYNISKLLDKPILGIIPDDPYVKEALKLKHPVVYAHPEAASSVEFKKLAGVLIGESYSAKIERKKKGNIFSFLRGKVNG